MGAFKRARGLALCCGLFLSLGGTQRLSAGFDDSGFIVDWLLFGPLIQSAGANPPPNIIGLDYLTDGAVNFEATILPKDGDELTPDYLGAAAAEGPHPILTDPPKWKATNSAANTIDFNAIYGAGSNVENAIVYAVAYIKNPPQDVDLRIELASDDSIEVKLDDCVAFLRSIGRGFGNPGDIQDRAPVKLSPGGQLLAAWGARGTAPGDFIEPYGIAVDDQGNVYVADAGNHRIQKLSPSGQALAQWGKRGPAPGESEPWCCPCISG